MIPVITTEAIELGLVSGEPITIKHGLGRQVTGWLILYMTEFVQLKIQDPSADTSRELTLIPSANSKVRLVLL